MHVNEYYYSLNFCIVLYWKSASREPGSHYFLLGSTIDLSILEDLEVTLLSYVLSRMSLFNSYLNSIFQILYREDTWAVVPTKVSCHFQYRTCPEKGLFYFSLKFFPAKNYITIPPQSPSKARLNYYLLVTNLAQTD